MIVGGVTVKLVVETAVNPVLLRSKILFIGNVTVYVPGVRFAVGVMVKILPVIVLVIGMFQWHLLFKGYQVVICSCFILIC